MANENNVSKTPVTNDDNTYILKVANDERNILASALIDQPEPPIESQIPPVSILIFIYLLKYFYLKICIGN